MQKEPKFSKVDAHTIRITIEDSKEVSLIDLINNRERLLTQKKQMQEDLKKQEKLIDNAVKNIDKILASAKEMGITAKIEPKKEKK
jgi:hypothetical protein